MSPLARPDLPERRGVSTDVHLLGVVDFDECLALQHRLLDEATGGRQPHGVILLCEHPAMITIGRSGSRLQVRMADRELAARNVDVRWVNRGGGALAHAPGQLAIYPVVSLEAIHCTVAEYMQRLQTALLATLAEMRIVANSPTGKLGAWGRTGQLAAIGVSIKNGGACHGAFINVSPSLDLFRKIGAEGNSSSTLSSLVAERPRGVRMAAVRESAARHFAQAIGGETFHLYAGHPWIDRGAPSRKRIERVG